MPLSTSLAKLLSFTLIFITCCFYFSLKTTLMVPEEIATFKSTSQAADEPNVQP